FSRRNNNVHVTLLTAARYRACASLWKRQLKHATTFVSQMMWNDGSLTATIALPTCAGISCTSQVAATLTSFCTLQSLAMKVPANTPGAVQQADGSYVVSVLVNPKPGEIGTLGNRSLTSFGTWFLDGNIQKTFRIRERNQLTFRMD